MGQQVLKVKIKQPNAHYRVPFSYQRRFTYPIPPYSTVKGLICNLLGIIDELDEKFKKIKELSLAIYGKYESMVKEYVWFRNLELKSHISKFGTSKNRFVDRVPQHPGGQIPVTVDVLQDVNLIIYIYHPDESFLKEIKNAFENPTNRLSTIHLGRAEDWIVIKEVKFLQLSKKTVFNLKYFAWIPEPQYLDENFYIESYKSFFDNLNGNLFRLPTFYEITVDNQRIFNEYVTVKLYEGGNFKRFELYVDNDENLPVILSKLRGNKDARA
ncbi:MAG: type I-B CRISPR-associated protein Cas5b [Thermodesulfovibrio sp.]|nr:type I-B CRISPR-associated protein Cas5b [Thermodesulfovibrio sp.]